MRRPLALPAAALVLLAGGPAAGAAEVRSGSLRVRAGGKPFTLTVRDGGRLVLAQRAGARLGVRTAAGWARATRATAVRRAGGAVVLRLATADPGRALELRLAPAGKGALRLTARAVGPAGGAAAVGIGLAGVRGERYLGFGQRSDAVTRRGTIVNAVAEGPYRAEDRALAAAVVPPWAVRDDDSASSFPVPWLLSTAGYGVLVEGDAPSSFELGRGAWSVSADGEALRLLVLAGPRPADALRRMTARAGRQPVPAAPWHLGVWVMPGDFDREDLPAERARVARLRRADVPVSVAETTMQELPCGDARALQAASRARARSFRAQGLAMLGYLNPHVCTTWAGDYPRFAAAGLFVRDPGGAPYVFRTFADRHVTVQVSLVDFAAPGAAAAYASVARRLVGDGHDGWMEDYGEYAPSDGVQADGATGPAGRNAYPRRYHCGAAAAARAVRPGLARFVRSGWLGSAPCSPLVWSGDPSAVWGFDGLRSAIFNGLSMGASGIALWASELGGLMELNGTRLSRELLVRWIELGGVSPWMKARRQSIRIPPGPGARPQVWDAGVLPVFRRYAKLHTQLWPYEQAAVARYARTGMPLMRHLALARPRDPAARQDDVFLFGPDLLAAPVHRPGARTRALRLPRGLWVDVWRSVRQGRAGALRLGAARVLRGGRDATLPAPLGELPLLARAGALLPLAAADVDTMTARGGRGLVRWADRRDRLELLALPRGRSAARFGRDGRIRSAELRGAWRLTVAARRPRRVALQASLRTLRRPLEPCAVRRAGRRLPYRWDRRTGVLRTAFAARRATITVEGC